MCDHGFVFKGMENDELKYPEMHSMKRDDLGFPSVQRGEASALLHSPNHLSILENIQCFSLILSLV
jgi:hypothetical protein